MRIGSCSSIPLAIHSSALSLRDAEARTLTWERINFLKGILTVGKSKTNGGTGRTIPINSELRQILEHYRNWYESKIGPAAPDRYVFPYGDNRKWDPSRPIGTLKTAWKTVRTRANVNARYHDLRHTAITNLCESGASEETIMAIAGHVSREMLSRYAHIRTEAKRKALEDQQAKGGSAGSREGGILKCRFLRESTHKIDFPRFSLIAVAASC